MSIDPTSRLWMNDDRVRLFRDTDRKIAFICECSDPQCRRTVVLTAAEYEATRPSPILHADHRVG